MTAIVGAGIGGLSAAHYLVKRTINPITIYEASERIGGWIQSHKFEGYTFEAGPRTLRPTGVPGRNTLEIVKDIELENYVLPIKSNHVAAKNRMIFAKNQLCLLPSSLMGALITRPPFSQPLLKLLLNDLKAKSIKVDDEPIHDFIKRRFGHEMADYMIGPLICGICAGDSKEISVNFLLRNLFQLEQNYGSINKGLVYSKLTGKGGVKEQQVEIFNTDLIKKAKAEKWRIYSFNGGLELLPQHLKGFVERRGVHVKMKSKCDKIMFHGKNAVEVTVNGETKKYSSVISTIPSFHLSDLVKDQHPKLATELSSIPFVDVAVINLMYNDPKLIKSPGFGVLVPPVEKLAVLGIIFDSCCFNISDRTVLTVMMGGKWFNELFGASPTDEQLIGVAKEHIGKILGISHNPDHVKVNVLRKCIPQYVVGHLARVQRIRDYVKQHELPLFLGGASYDGVGINDVILSSRRLVESKYIWE